MSEELSGVLDNIMFGGTTEVQQTSGSGTTEVQQTSGSGTTRESKKIRLDHGDYTRLQEIAAGEGTTAAALVRRAIKEFIKRSGRNG